MKMFLSGLGFLLASIVITFGATQSVTTSNDGGAGSLRAAIAHAAPGDTITFALPTPSTITLTTGKLLIDKKLTITGPGADLLTVARSSAGGTPAFPVFHTGTGSFAVTISGLTISNGNYDGITGSGRGGGLDNETSGTVTVFECNFMNNQATYDGGGVFNHGPGAINLSDCIVMGNTTLAGFGGGLAADSLFGGSASLLRCTISSNSAGYYGGGVYNANGSTMSIVDSTVSDNLLATVALGSVADGGGIWNTGILTITRCTIANNINGRGSGGGIQNQGTLTVTNSTFFGNTTAQDGGAILNIGPATITNCTVTGNTASQEFVSGGSFNGGGGISNFDVQFSATTTLRNTIVAGNDSPTNPNIAGAITSQGYNLIEDGTGGTLTPTTGDQIGTSDSPIDPLLGSPADNGGPTQTCALLARSPALDKGGSAAEITTDQRGDPRPVNDTLVPAARSGNNSDIGAFEAQVSQSFNISTRGQVLTGNNILDGGFMITGSAPKNILIRGIGPSLSSLGLSGVLADPTIELHGPNSETLLTRNDNWQETQEADIQPTGIAPTNKLESAILANLEPGAYTAILAGKDGGTGIGLVEVYDLDQLSDSMLANISARGFVGTDDDVLIGGFILGPSRGASSRILARVLGPSLAAVQVAGSLEDPEIELYDSNGVSVAFNDNWKDSQETQIQATGLAPADDKESAILETLAAGSYTAIVRGVGMTRGVALVEIYNLL